MFCPKCGKELPEGAQFCPSCGSSINPPEILHQSQESSNHGQEIPLAEQLSDPPVPNEEIKCPNCGATGCTPQYKQNVSGGGYGCCSGGLGALILGPLGLLCGVCGRSVKSTNTLVWICPKCGHEFQVLSEKMLYARSICVVCLGGILLAFTAFVIGFTIAFTIAFHNVYLDIFGLIIFILIGTIALSGFLFYKYTLPHITDEQKQQLKKIAIVMGIIAVICFFIPFILVASIQRPRV